MTTECCENCESMIQIAIFKNEGWCSAKCMKALAKSKLTVWEIVLGPGAKRWTIIQNARKRLGMPARNLDDELMEAITAAKITVNDVRRFRGLIDG